MKRLLVILLILSGIIGCTGTKKTSTFADNSRHASTERTDSTARSRNDSTSIDKSKTTVTDQSETKTEGSKTESSFSNSIIYFFDTSRPVNSFTGLPPVSSIYDNRTGANSNTQFSQSEIKDIRTEIENNIRKEFENSLEVRTKDLKNTVDKLDQKLKESESTVSQMKLILIGSVVLLIIILIFIIKFILK